MSIKITNKHLLDRVDSERKRRGLDTMAGTIGQLLLERLGQIDAEKKQAKGRKS